MLTGFLRRSIGRPAAAVFAILIGINTFARSTAWRHEWLWALLQYHFVTIFLGPLAAGLGTWEGRRWSGARPPATGQSARTTGAVLAWFATVAWIVAVYVIGLVAVVITVKLSHVPGWPSLGQLATIGPALALLTGWLAVGYGLAWTLRAGPALAPFVTIAAFAFTIAAWAGLPGHIVEVGGATTSLIGLGVQTPLLAAQTMLWVGVIVGSGAGIVLTATRRPTTFAAAAAGVVLLVGGYSWQLGIGGDRLVLAPGGVHCSGRPAVCLAPGYEHERGAVNRSLAPVLRLAAQHGLPTPRMFTQDGSQLGPGVAEISNGMLAGHTTDAGWALANTYLTFGCAMPPARQQAFADITALLGLDDVAGQLPAPRPTKAQLTRSLRIARSCPASDTP